MSILAAMAFDLGRAMFKKQEHESARLMDFEFRQRARSFRLLAAALGEDANALVRRTALASDEGILVALAASSERDLAELTRLHRECTAQARLQLIRELGDPTPHRLA